MTLLMKNRLKQAGQYLLLAAAAFGIALFFRHILHANPTTVALSFLILILFTAFRSRLIYSIFLSILCAVLYNFYFLPPIGSFTIADPQNLVALIAFLIAGIFVNHVSAKQRRQAEALARHQVEVEKLYEFSQRLLLEDRVQQLAQAVPALIAECFHLPAVALYLPGQDTAMWDPQHLLAGMESLQLASRLAEASSRSEFDAGNEIRNNVRIVPLLLGMKPLGALAMAESGFSESFYDAIGSLTAMTIERATAIERTSRSEAAREGEALRAALLDSITHELRTPLTGIRMAATTMLDSTSLDAASRFELATVISEESARLDRLIDEAVVMARLGAGEVQVQQDARNMAVIVESALGELRTRLRGRRVEVDITADLAPVLMDADLMRRVWKHLLENALQYSPAGSPIRISARVDRGRLLMKVADSGKGIAEQEQPLIFERFFRGANRRMHAEGTGMGLAIVKRILEAHQGGINVHSAQGEGTVFSFWIPVDASQAT